MNLVPSRFLLIGWCVWLVMALMMHRSVHTDDSEIHLVPLMRGLSISIMVFVSMIWPAWRLTFRPAHRPGWVCFRELTSILMIGLLALATKDAAVRFEDPTAWPLKRTLLIAAALLAWSLPVGLVVWYGLRSARPVVAMGLILVLIVGGWWLVGLGGPAEAATVSPWHALWVLGSADPVDTAPIGRSLLGVAALSAALWIGLRTLPAKAGPHVIIDVSNRIQEAQGMDFITQEEKKKLEEKLAEMIAKRPQITTRIAEARAHGDLKENAEYHAAREEQGLNEAEIRRLEERLSKAKVADQVEIPDDMVFLGATVKLRDTATDDEDMYRLVGESSGSFDADVVEVTASSPMGEALMKARVGETIRVDLPRGTRRFEIIEIV